MRERKLDGDHALESLLDGAGGHRTAHTRAIGPGCWRSPSGREPCSSVWVTIPRHAISLREFRIHREATDAVALSGTGISVDYVLIVGRMIKASKRNGTWMAVSCKKKRVAILDALHTTLEVIPKFG